MKKLITALSILCIGLFQLFQLLFLCQLLGRFVFVLFLVLATVGTV